MCTRASKIAASTRQSTEAFIRRARLKSRQIELLEPFKSMNTPIRAECLRCGHKWEPYPNNLTKGVGCPGCATERRKEKHLKEYGVEWTTQLPTVKQKIRKTMRKSME